MTTKNSTIKFLTISEEKEEADKKAKLAKKDLASDKGSSKGKDKKPNPSDKKHIIIKPKEKMGDWYK